MKLRRAFNLSVFCILPMVLVACGLEASGFLAQGQGASSSSSGGAVMNSSSSSGGGTGAGAGGQGGAGGSTAQCGNKIVDIEEECDDGNTIDGDGCSAQCVSEAVDSCPGKPVTLMPGTIELVGNTSIANNEYFPIECGDMIGKGNEYVYAVTPTVGGTLTIQLASQFAGVLYARRTCAGPYFNNQLECAHTGNTSEIKLWVYAGATYYVFADGETNIEDGPYSLKLTLEECGNGQLEGMEQCDKPSDPGCVGCVSCKGKDEFFESPDSKFENSVNGHCYWMPAQTSANWLDARRACLAWGGDLAAVSGWPESNYLNGVINADTWVGANDMSAEDFFEWSSGEPLRFLDWNPTEPNNLFDEDCAFVNGDIRFVDDDCSAGNHPYLCERVPQGKCGDGILQGIEECDDKNTTANDGCTNCAVDCNIAQNGEYKHPLTHHCYRIETVATKNWTDAAAACVAWGGRLASVETKYENTFIAEKIKTFGDNVFAWIGANDQAAENQFMWATGEPVLYTSWNLLEPNNQGEEDCVQLGASGGWNDFPCASAIPYVCERPAAGTNQ